jgi:ethanolamine transporter EutH
MERMIISAIIGIVVGFIAACVIIYAMRVREHKRRKEKKKKVSLNTYAKVATTAVLIHGMILTSCSYILASIGMDPVVDVSSTIVREIVAPLVVYLGTNTIMNIFEKNKLSFSIPLNSTVITKDGTTHSSAEDGAEG